MKLAPKLSLGFLCLCLCLFLCLCLGVGFFRLDGEAPTPGPARVISVEVGVTPSCPYGLAA